jgi:hypothetical protein
VIRGSRREPWPPIDMSSEYLCHQYLGLEAMWQVADRCFSFSRHAQRQPPTSALARCLGVNSAGEVPGGSRPYRRMITRENRFPAPPDARTGHGGARHPGGKPPARTEALGHLGRHPYRHRNDTPMGTRQPLSACRVTSSRVRAGHISQPIRVWLLVLSPGAFNDHICRLLTEVAQEQQERAGELRRGSLFCIHPGARLKGSGRFCADLFPELLEFFPEP